MRGKLPWDAPAGGAPERDPPRRIWDDDPRELAGGRILDDEARNKVESSASGWKLVTFATPDLDDPDGEAAGNSELLDVAAAELPREVAPLPAAVSVI